LNESHGYIWTKIKYEGIGVGHNLNGTIGRMDMDDIYQDVSTVRFCVEDQHSVMRGPVGIAIIFRQNKQYYKAVEFHNKALKVHEELDDKVAIA
jgi:hypothetical protein